MFGGGNLERNRELLRADPEASRVEGGDLGRSRGARRRVPERVWESEEPSVWNERGMALLDDHDPVPHEQKRRARDEQDYGLITRGSARYGRVVCSEIDEIAPGFSTPVPWVPWKCGLAASPRWEEGIGG